MEARFKKTAESWEHRAAALYSSGQKSRSLEVKEVFARRDWRIVESSDSGPLIFATTTMGHARLLIIDDTELESTLSVQREQLFHQIACMTPTLILCSKIHEPSRLCLESIGEPILVSKPLVPLELLSGLDELCDRWSQGYLLELRRAANKMIDGQVQSGYRILSDIVQSRQQAPLASAGLASYYRRRGDIKMAERVLVAAIKQGSFSLSIVLPLIDLYLYAAVPGLAIRLIEAAFERFEKPHFLCIDAVQALIMLNRVQDTVPYLQQLLEHEGYRELARHYLPRLYYSAGELDLFDRMIKYSPERFDEYQRAWHLLTEDEARRRKLQYEQLAATRGPNQRKPKREASDEGLERRSKGKPQPGLGFTGKPLFQNEGY